MAITDDQAKKLAASLAKRVAGAADDAEFNEDLAKYHQYQESQRRQGKKLREGKHSRELAPLIAALPKGQRALGLGARGRC